MEDATVVRQDPDQYRLWVSIDRYGGQVPFLSVDVTTIGHRDAVRGHWPALPVVGTRGRVSFTRGDDRTGRWEGASTPALTDSSALSPGQGNVDYRAGYAGDWSWIGHDGTRVERFADGGTLLLGAAMPVPTRHILDANGARVRSVFTDAQRNPSPPAAFPLAVALGNGLVVTATASGTTTIMAPAGQSLTLAVAGGASITLNPDGTVTLMGMLNTTGDNVAGFGGANVSALMHVHPTGSPDTGPPVPGT